MTPALVVFAMALLKAARALGPRGETTPGLPIFHSRATWDMMYEPSKHPLLGRPAFFKRVLNHAFLALLMIGAALGIGVLGYHWLGGLGWVDSLLNASMILGGMGPVDPMTTDAAKVFASLYALFSGLMFVGVASVMIAPFLHRILHRFHLDDS